MGSGLFKLFKKHPIPYIQDCGKELECYVYDKFFRFIEVIPPEEVIHHIIYNSGDKVINNIYLTHRLKDHRTRSIENINNIQYVSFYLRPAIENVSLLERLSYSDNIMLAGLTPAGGARIVIPVKTSIKFASVEARYKTCYNYTLKLLKEYFQIPTPKFSSSDIFGCVSMLRPESVVFNPKATAIIVK